MHFTQAPGVPNKKIASCRVSQQVLPPEQQRHLVGFSANRFIRGHGQSTQAEPECCTLNGDKFVSVHSGSMPEAYGHVVNASPNIASIESEQMLSSETVQGAC